MGGTNTETGNSIAIDTLGSVYITGTFGGVLDFDPSANVSNLTSVGVYDIFIAKYDGSGNYIYAKNIGGIHDDAGNSITVDASGNVYITGYFKNAVDFDPSANILNLQSISSHNAFIAKYSQDEEMIVKSNNIIIANGDNTPDIADNTNFGSVIINTSVTKQFTIECTIGYFDLVLPDNPKVTVTGNGFTLATDAPEIIHVGDSAVFQITFTPNTCGNFSGSISIANSDEDKNPYTFSISGSALDTIAPEIPELDTISAECSITIATIPTTTDNCAGFVTGTTTDTLFYDMQGNYSITWSFDDGNGNVSTAVQQLVIEDVTIPTIVCAENQTINLTEGQNYYTVQENEFDATDSYDNCGISNIENNLNLTNTLANEHLPVGINTIEWTITDNAGNYTTCLIEITVNEYVSVSEINKNEIQIYPNPTKGELRITNYKSQIKNIEIINITGKTIQTFSNSKTEIDLNSQVSGIYFIKIITENGVFVEKIIKE